VSCQLLSPLFSQAGAVALGVAMADYRAWVGSRCRRCYTKSVQVGNVFEPSLNVSIRSSLQLKLLSSTQANTNKDPSEKLSTKQIQAAREAGTCTLMNDPCNPPSLPYPTA